MNKTQAHVVLPQRSTQAELVATAGQSLGAANNAYSNSSSIIYNNPNRNMNAVSALSGSGGPATAVDAATAASTHSADSAEQVAARLSSLKRRLALATQAALSSVDLIQSAAQESVRAKLARLLEGSKSVRQAVGDLGQRLEEVSRVGRVACGVVTVWDPSSKRKGLCACHGWLA